MLFTCFLRRVRWCLPAGALIVKHAVFVVLVVLLLLSVVLFECVVVCYFFSVTINTCLAFFLVEDFYTQRDLSRCKNTSCCLEDGEQGVGRNIIEQDRYKT